MAIELPRSTAADVLAFIRAFEAHYEHPFIESIGLAVVPLRDVLTREEHAAADDRYLAFQETTE